MATAAAVAAGGGDSTYIKEARKIQENIRSLLDISSRLVSGPKAISELHGRLKEAKSIAVETHRLLKRFSATANAPVDCYGIEKGQRRQTHKKLNTQYQAALKSLDSAAADALLLNTESHPKNTCTDLAYAAFKDSDSRYSSDSHRSAPHSRSAPNHSTDRSGSNSRLRRGLESDEGSMTGRIRNNRTKRSSTDIKKGDMHLYTKNSVVSPSYNHPPSPSQQFHVAYNPPSYKSGTDDVYNNIHFVSQQPQISQMVEMIGHRSSGAFGTTSTGTLLSSSSGSSNIARRDTDYFPVHVVHSTDIERSCIGEKTRGVLQIEKDVRGIRELYQEMAWHISSNSDDLDAVETQMRSAVAVTGQGLHEIDAAHEMARTRRRYLFFITFGCVILIFIFCILLK